MVAVRIASPGEPPQRVSRGYGVILEVQVKLAAHLLEPVGEGVADGVVASDSLGVRETLKPVAGREGGTVHSLIARVE